MATSIVGQDNDLIQKRGSFNECPDPKLETSSVCFMNNSNSLLDFDKKKLSSPFRNVAKTFMDSPGM